jgi:hypothetical protein
VLLLTGLLFGLAIGFQHQVAVPVVVLAAAAGASGATVSAMLKFRDEVRLGAQQREFLSFYLVQAGVGAVFGRFIALVFAAGWLSFKPAPRASVCLPSPSAFLSRLPSASSPR